MLKEKIIKIQSFVRMVLARNKYFEMQACEEEQRLQERKGTASAKRASDASSKESESDKTSLVSPDS